MAAKKSEKSQIGYAEALNELEEILSGLEDEDVDVDTLAEQVKRAAELIESCRERIGAAKLRIEEVEANADND